MQAIPIVAQLSQVNGPVHAMSARELECLEWAARGKTYKDIGAIVGLSFGAVKTYLDTARYKLNAINLPHAVARAVSRGLISVD
jgi:DNA-binding CsgD family transcriptional regulator